MKANWLSWLALLFAAAALLISFVFIGQARDTTGQLEAAVDTLNQVIQDYGEVIDQYNRISDDYWEWRAEQNDT